MQAAFDDGALLFWDAPGCGASTISAPDALSIPFLVKVALEVLRAHDIDRFHMSGHSMGGLTALLLAHAQPERILSFVEIEGNISPEDCFFSRQIIEHPADTPQAFAQGFIDRVRARTEYGSAVYAAGLPAKVRDTSYAPIFTSMVDLSDTAPLTEMLTGLPCPTCFVHGVKNSHLSYLDQLPTQGVQVVAIPLSGHFPMYTNPPALWATMAEFIEKHDPAP